MYFFSTCFNCWDESVESIYDNTLQGIRILCKSIALNHDFFVLKYIKCKAFT